MKKATHQSNRTEILNLQQIINIGPATAAALQRIGIERPQQLRRRSPWQLYQKLCQIDKEIHDPCVLDCLMSAVDYMNGNKPQVWWNYTKQRKELFRERLQKINI